jgi:hypothetical protein
MPNTSAVALPYPAASDPPDGPGAIYNLATTLDGLLGAKTFAPVIAGGGGAALGTSGGSDGSYIRVGKHVTAKGRLLFGSGASFGTGTATVSNLPASIDTNHSTGYGWFQSGGTSVPCMFTPADSANMAIRPIIGGSGSFSTLGTASAIGTPAQSSALIFTLDLLLA